MLELANLNSFVEENVEMKMVSLGKITRMVIDSFVSVAEKKKVVLKCATTATADMIWCNQDQMMIMISNILDNAIIYSLENTQVDIVVAGKENGPVSISITDRGIGIPEQNMPKIFQEYFRSNNAAKKHENGTGLGLSISRRIADIHRAEIEVESVLGKGTTFRVIFRNPGSPK